MKFLIHKIICFISPIIFIILIYFGLISLISYSLTKNSKPYKIEKNIETLILGDSHITHAIDDKQILNSKNLGKPAESYYYTYQKLVFFNDQINCKKVILGYSYHNLSSIYDQFINGWFSAQIAPCYFFILSNIEQLRVLNWNKSKTITFFKNLLKVINSHRFNKSDINLSLYEGHNIYEHQEKFIFNSMLERKNFQFFEKLDTTKILPISHFNLLYLNKIITYCNENDINVTLLSTPLHTSLRNEIPISYKINLQNFINGRDVDFLKLDTLSLRDNYYSNDGDHVNKLGAIKTTKILVDILNNNFTN